MKLKLVRGNVRQELCVQFIPENEAEKEILDLCVETERIHWYDHTFTVGTGFKRE